MLQRSPYRRAHGAGRTLLNAAALCLALSAAVPRPAQGQWVTATAGLAAGAVAGIYTSTAIYVVRARTGHFLYSLEEATDVRIENLPMVGGPILGAVVGWRSGAALGAATLWGMVGFIGTGVLGAGAGHLIWGTPEGRWAGAIIGSAAGMLIGATLGARSRWDPDESPGATAAGLSIPTPFDEP